MRSPRATRAGRGAPQGATHGARAAQRAGKVATETETRPTRGASGRTPPRHAPAKVAKRRSAPLEKGSEKGSLGGRGIGAPVESALEATARGEERRNEAAGGSGSPRTGAPWGSGGKPPPGQVTLANFTP